MNMPYLYYSSLLRKHAQKLLFTGLLATSVSFSSIPLAEAQSKQMDQFSAANALPLGGDIIKTSRFNINLWGIRVPGDEDHQLKARERLDRAINNKPLKCRIFGWQGNMPFTQCTNTSEQDLAILLLSEGYAYTDREALIQHPNIKTAYDDAEQRAVVLEKGIWINKDKSANTFLDFESLRPDLRQNLFMILAILSVGPLVGLVLVALVMFSGFGRLVNLQKRQIARANKDSKEMREREKSVLASSLEGEITANRSKVEAFVSIYKEMLKELRNPNKTPKYRQTGDIIHEKPSLSRMVYDANLDKIDLLGPSVASLLSQLYSEIETNPKYQTLDPEVPLQEAEERIGSIVSTAQKSIPIMDKLIAGLKVLNRNK